MVEVEIEAVDPATPAAEHCLRAYFSELERRFENGFDSEAALVAARSDYGPPEGLFLVAMRGSEPVGCVALQIHGNAGDVKRMWVSPDVRGLGLGRRLLAAVEDRAKAGGATTIRLETNRVLAEAIAFYRAAGYDEVEPFNDEPYAHHWFQKNL